MTDIKPEWTYAAREWLARVAAEGKTTTYGKFYDAMAPICGWNARTQGQWWTTNAAHLLLDLARLNKVFNEPMLSALVRQADSGPGGVIGNGFGGAVLERYGVIPENVQAFARVEAGKCFVHYGRPR